MRALLALLLLAAAVAADDLVEVAKIRYVDVGAGLAPIATGNGYLPVFLTQRDAGRGNMRVVGLGTETFMESKLAGQCLGMARQGDGIVLGMNQGGKVVLLEMVYEGRRHVTRERQAFDLNTLTDPRVLRILSLGRANRVVVAHAGGLAIGEDRIERPGRRYGAASNPYEADGDGILDLFAADGETLLHLNVRGERFEAKAEIPHGTAGLEPRAMEGAEGRLWVGGAANGRAMLVLLDQRQGGRPRGPTGPERFDLGPGAVNHLAMLADGGVVVGGVRDGRSWVAVLRGGHRPVIEHEGFLSGAGVNAMTVNPARRGWTIAASTDDRMFRLLRVASDEPAPPGWDPFVAPVPGPGPAPAPPETEVPGAEDPPQAGGGHGGSGPSPAAGAPDRVVFPRVEAQARFGQDVDTEFVAINLGREPMRLSWSFFQDDGRLVAREALALAPQQRARLKCSAILAKQRAAAFDGYAVIDGARKDDLVLEGIRREGPERAEVLRPHWR
jgi:hypothetical protein